ncbi:MAG: PAS domain-containing protein [Timaviella obliquedivisa GSE-PSE-MK23-08B]|nr:PAS domain-containing protein [Timaviella obliquedivisa GSE-PSE-MK23-08B]
MPQQPVTCNQSRLVLLHPRSNLMMSADQLNLPMAVWDLRRMEVQFSSGLEHLYQLEPEEFQGKYLDFLSHVHPDDRRPIQKVLQAAAENGQSFEVDYRIINKSNEIVWLSSKGQIFISNRVGGAELVEVINDVTPRYQARQALVESNAQWDALLKKSDELLIQLDFEAHVFWTSPSIGHILGYPPELLMGESILNLVHDADLRKVLLALDSLKERKIPQSFQCSLKQQSGKYLPVQSTLRLGEELGSFAVLSFREISARVNLQSVLESTYAAYTAIVDATTDLVFRFLPDGTLTFTNHLFENCFGDESGVGSNFYSVLPDDDRDRLQATCAILTPENPTATCSLEALRGIRHPELRCQALFDHDDRLLEYQVVAKEMKE